MIRWIRMLSLLIVFVAATPAMAQDVDPLLAAQEAGLVGEMQDGLIAPTALEPTDDILALAERINAARMESYRVIARQAEVQIEAVQAMAGARLIGLLPAGCFYMDAAGAWVGKPAAP
ncbi:MAG: DUF1318 domain-containing protein [Pseudomonadota bacterium]|nr:DUF1318 domain-containing protein [Pseudomonadota bacterium]